MRHLLFFLLALTCAGTRAENRVQYVNPLIGTDSDYSLSAGNTYPAVAMPWGMNFWTPQTGRMGDGWTYTYRARHIRGLKQTHQPSPWINDYGQFSLMPVTGKKITEEARKSYFSHKAETATPYYYSVYLADHDIVAELTPTERAARFRFTYPASDSAALVIDAFDRGSSVRVEGNRIYGYTTRHSGGVPDNFKNYFVVELPETWVAEAQVWSGEGVVEPGRSVCADHTGAYVLFRPTRRGTQIEVRVASSFISEEQAVRNLQELSAPDFDAQKAAGEARWNEVLGRIGIEASVDVKRVFYSCLYRSVLFPRQFFEYDEAGRPVHYSPFDGRVHSGRLFTDTGFWDTFRSLFPLLNLVYPDMNAHMQEGLLNTYRESGFLPEWASPGHRDCMVGNNSASVVADAMLKGVTPDSLRLPLYMAMLKTANDEHPTVGSTGRKGYKYYNESGYVPCDKGINESVARTLEYAYDDWCIAQAGKLLHRPKKEIALYERRAQNYRHVFDPSTHLMRGRKADGSFATPFNPLKWGGDFTEGNSWHYTWSVFHDVDGLMGLMGGKEGFTAMLDSVFALPPVFDCSYYGQVIHEIREMQIMNMGNYAHGNQPIQHAIYLYDYAGRPEKAQRHLREVMQKLYTATPDGYCGDEDNGQTSAWYVFSAMGFYPVCPGADAYAVGAPLVSKAVISRPDGTRIEIVAPQAEATPYWQTLSVNGKPLTAPFLHYSDLTQGATVRFGYE